MPTIWLKMRKLLGYRGMHFLHGKLLCVVAALLMLQVSATVPTGNWSALAVTSAEGQAGCLRLPCELAEPAMANPHTVSLMHAGGRIAGGDLSCCPPHTSFSHNPGQAARMHAARLTGIGPQAGARLGLQASLRSADPANMPGSRRGITPRNDITSATDVDGDSDPVAIPGRSGDIALAQAQSPVVMSVPALPMVVLRNFIPPSWRTS